MSTVFIPSEWPNERETRGDQAPANKDENISITEHERHIRSERTPSQESTRESSRDALLSHDISGPTRPSHHGSDSSSLYSRDRSGARLAPLPVASLPAKSEAPVIVIDAGSSQRLKRHERRYLSNRSLDEGRQHIEAGDIRNDCVGSTRAETPEEHRPYHERRIGWRDAPEEKLAKERLAGFLSMERVAKKVAERRQALDVERLKSEQVEAGQRKMLKTKRVEDRESKQTFKQEAPPHAEEQLDQRQRVIPVIKNHRKINIIHASELNSPENEKYALVIAKAMSLLTNDGSPSSTQLVLIEKETDISRSADLQEKTIAKTKRDSRSMISKVDREGKAKSILEKSSENLSDGSDEFESVSDCSVSVQTALDSAMNVVKGLLLRDLFEYASTEAKEAAGSSESSSKGSAATNTKYLFAPSVSHSSSSDRSGKRARGGHDPGDNGGDDSDDDGDDDRPRKKGSPDRFPLRRLKCPFYQRQPEHYTKASCRGEGFADIAKLKDHLKRVHTQPLRCSRCRAEMASDDDLEEHLNRDDICEKRPAPHDDRIRPQLLKKLEFKKSPFANARNIEEKWKMMYKMLFPADTESEIPSPYDQNTLSPDLSRALSEALEEELTRELGPTLDPIIARIKSRIPSIIRLCRTKLARRATQTSNDHIATPSSRHSNLSSSPTGTRMESQSSAEVDNSRSQSLSSQSSFEIAPNDPGLGKGKQPMYSTKPDTAASSSRASQRHPIYAQTNTFADAAITNAIGVLDPAFTTTDLSSLNSSTNDFDPYADHGGILHNMNEGYGRPTRIMTTEGPSTQPSTLPPSTSLPSSQFGPTEPVQNWCTSESLLGFSNVTSPMQPHQNEAHPYGGPAISDAPTWSNFSPEQQKSYIHDCSELYAPNWDDSTKSSASRQYPRT